MPRFLDVHELVILRRGRKPHRCEGRRRRAERLGPIHWQGIAAGNLTGRHAGTATWHEHEPHCTPDLPAGGWYVESLAEARPYESGTRYSIACAARWCLDMTTADLLTRIRNRFGIEPANPTGVSNV